MYNIKANKNKYIASYIICWIIGGSIIAHTVPQSMEMVRITALITYCIASQFLLKAYIFKEQE